MRGDLMLAWMSETAAGGVLDLRQRIAWLARTSGLTPGRSQVGRWIRDVSSLGHAEVDWEAGQWAVTPAAAALLPACGGTAVLVGTRTPGLMDKLEASRHLSVQTVVPDRVDGRDLRLPPRVYVQSDSIDQLILALRDLGVRYVGNAAQHIGDVLTPIHLGAPAAPPARDTAVTHLEIGKELQFVDGYPDEDGLCCITVYGRASYLYRLGAEWFHADRAQGIYWAIEGRRRGIIRWRHERDDVGGAIGSVFVDVGAPLPPLQARAFVLSSGIATEIGTLANTAIYHNVPRSLAEQVARSLRQYLTVMD